MPDIFIHQMNEVDVRIECEFSILMEMQERFSFMVPGYKFNPKFKMGVWDGAIRLINTRNMTAPKGLVPKILDWANECDYSVKLDSFIIDSFRLSVEFDWESLNLPFKPHDYQELAVDIALRKKRQLLLSSTGSGKSLIIYALVRAYQNAIEEHEKILIIVPTISLVSQLVGDFKDYAVNVEWDAYENCHMITGGVEKNASKQVVVSTWQSIYKQPKSYFSQYTAIIGDEVHTFQATSCNAIMNKAENAFFRVGLTGTLTDAKVHEMQLNALFGPVTRVSSTGDLMKRGVLSDLEITSIVLKHCKESTDLIRGADYKQEIDFLVGHNKRNKMISKLAATRTGNTLVMFQYVHKHGKPLFDMIKEECGDTRDVFMVYGGTEADQRDNVRKICEARSGVIVVCSYQVFSTGVNIKNLHNAIFASPTKSKIRILQSIGRGLRLHDSKDHFKLYDIGDDLRGGRKKMNYTLNHYVERYKMYLKEGFKVKTKEIPNF